MAKLANTATGGTSEFKKGGVLVRCTDIKKSYDGRPILKGIDLEVKKGETLVMPWRRSSA